MKLIPFDENWTEGHACIIKHQVLYKSCLQLTRVNLFRARTPTATHSPSLKSCWIFPSVISRDFLQNLILCIMQERGSLSHDREIWWGNTHSLTCTVYTAEGRKKVWLTKIYSDFKHEHFSIGIQSLKVPIWLTKWHHGTFSWQCCSSLRKQNLLC